MSRWQRAAALLFLSGVTITLAFSCSDAAESVFNNPTGPCDAELKDLCGGSCTTDEECADGLYCKDGACYADCTATGGQCPSGSTCDDKGRCIGGGKGGNGGSLFGTGGTFSSVGGSGGHGGDCGSVEISFEAQIPTVVMLIDQSGSMSNSFNGQTRWKAVYEALMDPNSGVVKPLDAQVRFGLALYSYSGGKIPADPGTCPELVDVLPPALNNHAAIDMAYKPQVPKTDTPTGDSVNAVVAELDKFNEPGPKLIILATDGAPDRCEDKNGHDAVSMKLATDAVEAAFTKGIQTVIIAVGGQVSQQHQQDMANGGSGLPVPATDPCNDPMVCAPTFQPSTKQALIDSLNEIIMGQRTCVFTLNGEVIEGKECEGAVKVNDVLIPCNDPNGWQLNSPGEIEFLGTTCETIMNDANVTIEASFPCDSIQKPPT